MKSARAAAAILIAAVLTHCGDGGDGRPAPTFTLKHTWLKPSATATGRKDGNSYVYSVDVAVTEAAGRGATLSDVTCVLSAGGSTVVTAVFSGKTQWTGGSAHIAPYGVSATRRLVLRDDTAAVFASQLIVVISYVEDGGESGLAMTTTQMARADD